MKHDWLALKLFCGLLVWGFVLGSLVLLYLAVASCNSKSGIL